MTMLRKIGKDAVTSAAPIIMKMMKDRRVKQSSNLSARDHAEVQKRNDMNKKQLQRIGKEAATAAAPIVFNMMKKKMANRKRTRTR